MANFGLVGAAAPAAAGAPVAAAAGLFNPLDLAIFAADLVGGYGEFSANKKKAQMTERQLERQMAMYGQQRDQLAKAYEYKRGLIGDIYGKRIEETKDLFGTEIKGFQLGKETLNKDIENKKAATGFAYSGTVEEMGESATEKFDLNVVEQRQRFASNLSQLKDTLSSAQFQNTMERDQVLSNIDITIEGLRGQEAAAHSASKEKYLGIFG